MHSEASAELQLVSHDSESGASRKRRAQPIASCLADRSPLVSSASNILSHWLRAEDDDSYKSGIEWGQALRVITDILSQQKLPMQ